jgi:hypothetical protein
MNNEWLCPLPPEKIPANFEWVAQDASGYWFAYEVKPKLPRSRNMFLKVTGQSMQVGYRFKLIGDSIQIVYAMNWRNTLMKIPR